MPKGVQRNDKSSKKPKKDSGSKETSFVSDRPVAPTTSVMPKGKLKNKPN